MAGARQGSPAAHTRTPDLARTAGSGVAPRLTSAPHSRADIWTHISSRGPSERDQTQSGQLNERESQFDDKLDTDEQPSIYLQLLMTFRAHSNFTTSHSSRKFDWFKDSIDGVSIIFTA